MRKQKGFTLIELLVVIAIIALLLSILMPSLQKVKKQAQTVVGRSNHRQLYLSLTMYTEDNDNKLWRGFVWIVEPPNPDAYSNWWMPALITYSGEIPKIRFCPTATKTRTAINMTSRGIGYHKEPFTAWGYDSWLNGISVAQGSKNCHFGSYAVNGWIEDSWNETGTDSQFYWRRSNKISQADKVPFLTDGQWIDVWPKPSYGPPATENEVWNEGAVSQMTRIVQNRHNKNQNVVFMDGSSRLTGLKQLWTLKWHRQYNTRGVWTLANGVTPGMWPPWMQGMKAY